MFAAGTVKENLSLVLDPTLKSTSEVTAAVHAADGTEIAAETATVTTADVQFSNQTHELDEHGEIHTITVNKASAGKPYYIDFHTNQGTLNKTQVFDAGTTKESFEVVLDQTIKSDTEVTAAVHAQDGTELAASTAMVEVTEGESQTTTTADEVTEEESQATTTADENSGGETTTEGTTGESGPGFGIVVAVVALIGAAFVGMRYSGS